jgi:glycosyltransferase involved in cell wall biosynthesis
MVINNERKILFVATLSSTIDALLVDHIIFLNQHGYEVDIAARIDRPLSERIKSVAKKIIDIPFSRNPFNIINFKAYNKIKELIKSNEYGIVHTHTPIASAIVRLATKKSDTRIFYTAHGFHFHKKSGFLSWITYYPLEKYLSKYTDTLILINHEDYILASKKFMAKRIRYINGVGYNFDKFYNKRKEKSPNNKIIFLSVGEINKNKNHIKVIKAFKKIYVDFKYYIAGVGPLEHKLKKTIDKYKMNDKIQLLGFVSNIENLLSNSDIFIFPSLREGLGLAAIEAMAAGLPLITSNVHGINDYSIEDKSGTKFNPRSIKSIRLAIEKMIHNVNMWPMYGSRNTKKAKEYDFEHILPQVAELYGIKYKKLNNDS